jgi:hypothetical protein
MSRKKTKSPGEVVVGRVASALIECPLTGDEVRTLERIEGRRHEAELEQRRATGEAQRKAAYAKATKAGEDAVELMRRVNARREAKWSARALAELDALADLRGEAMAKTPEGARVVIAPLARLYRAGLIFEPPYEAGKIYGATWQRLYGGRTGDGSGSGELDALESRIADLKRLDEARGYVRENRIDVGGRKIVPTGLGGDARLIALCDNICGAELSLRRAIGASAHKRKLAMPRFKTALGLLALHYGLLKTREDELRAA